MFRAPPPLNPPLHPQCATWELTWLCMQVTSSLHIMGKPHIEHSGIMKINNLQSSLAAKIKFEASSRLSWGESHQVLYHAFAALLLLDSSSPPSPSPSPSPSLHWLTGSDCNASLVSYELLLQHAQKRRPIPLSLCPSNLAVFPSSSWCPACVMRLSWYQKCFVRNQCAISLRC